MKPRINNFLCLLVFVSSFSYSQIGQFDYKRELKGIDDLWHKIVLPNDFFGKVSSDFSDIRIYGITASQDTIEVPFLLQLKTDEISRSEVAFKTINASHSEDGYYSTFEIPTSEPVNQISLQFNEKNFDRLLKLEGSQDQQQWYTIVEDYRILSIKNELTDFQFTKINFPSAKYRFFRILINGEENPELLSAQISQYEYEKGILRTYPLKNSRKTENEEKKQTEIDVDLMFPLPVSLIKLKVLDTLDYYRPINIKYLTDSLETEMGWKYNYRTLWSGTLNSLENNEFKFSSTFLQHLRITISNHDNRPLSLNIIEVKGYIHEIIARFTEPASYFLVYGNEKAGRPRYDINRFTNKLPEEITALDLGDEIVIEKTEEIPISPLFKNKAWLWTIMVVIIAMLGWFSIRMMKKDQKRG